MATIYRFIVEQKTTATSGARKDSARDSGSSKKKTAKSGRWVSILGGEKGGVEHNRKMRAINPLFNKLSSGYWEKGMRLGRAASGLVTRNTETGKLGISGPAIAIIIAMILQVFMKYHQREIDRNNKLNAQNFKMLENGVGAVHGEYSIATNHWDGRITFNENK